MIRESSIAKRIGTAVLAGGLIASSGAEIRAAQFDIDGPPGSSAFGRIVKVLPSGNIVVVDPDGPTANVGAVYLYSPEGALLSTLTGSSAGDQVGSGGVIVLSNGNFVVISPKWNSTSPPVVDAGAVTWMNGETGLNGVVSSVNSLVGSRRDDQQIIRVTELANGNYVIAVPAWDNATIADAGAVLLVDGDSGIAGSISPSNAMVGSSAFDSVSNFGVLALRNGNFVVMSPQWNNAGVVDVGAVTWIDGELGRTGPVSAVDSLIGTAEFDLVGIGEAVALANGNFVVSSPLWNNGSVIDAGAATWMNGAVGTTRTVTAVNSLVGSTEGDRVSDAGGNGITALANGNYVVSSPNWDNGAIESAGAVTWGDGSAGVSGPVSAGNSLVGASALDQVGLGRATALANGNYVVASPFWGNGVLGNLGAATWSDGATGRRGIVSPSNSLVGSVINDAIGSSGVVALTNGHYAVGSAGWSNGNVSNAGAVTWGNGETGVIGAVSASNSLVGLQSGDAVGQVVALANGNYIANSPGWSSGSFTAIGAVTWANGAIGRSGIVSPANSLIGVTNSDGVGSSIFALANGNAVVASSLWDDGNIANVGALTWVDGATGIVGVVSQTNSLIGTSSGDQVGSGFSAGDSLLTGDIFAVKSSSWDDGVVSNVGAISFARGDQAFVGRVSAANSVTGAAVGGGLRLTVNFDPVREVLIVGRPVENKVSLRPLPLYANGFD